MNGESLTPPSFYQEPQVPVPIAAPLFIPHPTDTKPSIIAFFQSRRFHRLISIGIGALLTIQGLSNLFESLKFVFIEYPELSELLKQHDLGSEELTRLIMRAIVLMTTSIVGLFIASRLTHGGEEVEESAETIMGIIMLFAAAGIRKIVEEGDIVAMAGEAAYQVLHWLQTTF